MVTPYEILLSESQERMLVVAKKGHEQHVVDILTRWDLMAAVVGEVIAEPEYRVTEGGRVVAEFPGSRLVTDCPVYYPEYRESDEIAALRARDVTAVEERTEEQDPVWVLEQMLSSPTIASKRWVHRQFDTSVGTSTVAGPGGDAAVVRLRGTNKALAMCTDGNGRYVYLEPRVGGRIAVAEAARNVACTGARPMAITNCLNFGNPKKPEVFWQFREAVAGMGEACTALGTPVTGGNVSLYNESPTSSVYPTPVVGMIGLVEQLEHITPMGFQREGDTIVLFGENTAELGGSEYLQRIHGVVAGAPPACDLEVERALIEALLEGIRSGVVVSAHDCADGGLAVAIAECAIGDRNATRGCRVVLNAWNSLPERARLYGEAQGRAVLTTRDPAALLAVAERHGVPARVIGQVGGERSDVTLELTHRTIRAPADSLAHAYHDAIPALMSRAAAAVDVTDTLIEH